MLDPLRGALEAGERPCELDALEPLGGSTGRAARAQELADLLLAGEPAPAGDPDAVDEVGARPPIAERAQQHVALRGDAHVETIDRRRRVVEQRTRDAQALGIALAREAGPRTHLRGPAIGTDHDACGGRVRAGLVGVRDRGLLAAGAGADPRASPDRRARAL